MTQSALAVICSAMKPFKRPPKKYQPDGYDILYEDWDVLVGNKAAGYLSVNAKFDREKSIQAELDHYIRKGQAKSHKSIFVVHRLDQPTTGVLIFAKSEAAQLYLKSNWTKTKKTYLAIVHGLLKKKKGRISSQLEEDEDYVVHSSQEGGKIAHTEYKVIKEAGDLSLVEINLVTGRKNQIRVHMAAEGHPVVGDVKYGDAQKDRGLRIKNLALHAAAIEFDHPHSKKRMKIEAPVPGHFHWLVRHDY
jgi:tRNA pseudouridine32 synthase/23S rRNA pseudouridine746 synthase/23S rRNA pseudouridine1911/1915/1917 synthase